MKPVLHVSIMLVGLMASGCGSSGAGTTSYYGENAFNVPPGAPIGVRRVSQGYGYFRPGGGINRFEDAEISIEFLDQDRMQVNVPGYANNLVIERGLNVNALTFANPQDRDMHMVFTEPDVFPLLSGEHAGIVLFADETFDDYVEIASVFGSETNAADMPNMGSASYGGGRTGRHHQYGRQRRN